MLVDQLLERYQKNLLDETKSEGTVQVYRSDAKWLFKTFSIISPLDIPHLSPKEIQQQLAQFKSGTQRRKLAGLRSFFRFLTTKEGISCSFFIPYPKNDDDQKADESFPLYISREIYLAMRSHTFPCKKGHPPNTPRNLALLDLLYGNGLSERTLSHLIWENIDLLGNHLRGIEGYLINLPLTEESQESLRVYKEVRKLQDNIEPLLINRFHERLGKRSIREIIQQYGESVDLHISPSSLRWSYFVNLMDQGAAPEEVLKLMGYSHSTYKSRVVRGSRLRKKYLQFKEAQQEKAI